MMKGQTSVCPLLFVKPDSCYLITSIFATYFVLIITNRLLVIKGFQIQSIDK